MDQMPEALHALVEEVPVVVDDEPSRELLEEIGMEPTEDLFGLHTGIALTERSVSDAPELPESIHLFRRPKGEGGAAKTTTRRKKKPDHVVTEAEQANAKAYAIDLEFAAADVISHAKFGYGKVKTLKPGGKMEVAFDGGIKVLLCKDQGSLLLKRGRAAAQARMRSIAAARPKPVGVTLAPSRSPAAAFRSSETKTISTLCSKKCRTERAVEATSASSPSSSLSKGKSRCESQIMSITSCSWGEADGNSRPISAFKAAVLTAPCSRCTVCTFSTNLAGGPIAP